MKQTTYKLIDRDNTLLDVNADPIDLDALADLLERMKTVEERESPNSSHSFISSFFHFSEAHFILSFPHFFILSQDSPYTDLRMPLKQK